ncbi:hypothetical protein LTR56_007594 [Elasticomyces elasticus]|nr:hypothetical protein LTR56_007594 [Elasticomyces elasticus]KAK3665295.1 hypothetical protein LTR22_003817 [Elasticomyces elasticus]
MSTRTFAMHLSTSTQLPTINITPQSIHQLAHYHQTPALYEILTTLSGFIKLTTHTMLYQAHPPLLANTFTAIPPSASHHHLRFLELDSLQPSAATMNALITSAGITIRAFARGVTFIPAVLISAVPYILILSAWAALAAALIKIAPINRFIRTVFDKRNDVCPMDIMAWGLTSYVGATLQWIWLGITYEEPGLMLDETTQMSWLVKIMTSFMMTAITLGLAFGLICLLVGCLMARSGRCLFDAEGRSIEKKDLPGKEV